MEAVQPGCLGRLDRFLKFLPRDLPVQRRKVGRLPAGPILIHDVDVVVLRDVVREKAHDLARPCQPARQRKLRPTVAIEYAALPGKK